MDTLDTLKGLDREAYEKKIKELAKKPFKEVAPCISWTDPDDWVLAKQYQWSTPLAWWIKFGDFKAVIDYFKAIKPKENAQYLNNTNPFPAQGPKIDKKKGPKEGLWEHIKGQKNYPYEGVDDYRSNEIFGDLGNDVTEAWKSINADKKLDYYKDARTKKKFELHKKEEEPEGPFTKEHPVHPKEISQFLPYVNAYDMVNYFVCPATRGTGVGISMLMHTKEDLNNLGEMDGSKQKTVGKIKDLNKEEKDVYYIKTLPQVMVSHSWAEDMDQVLEQLNMLKGRRIILADGSEFGDDTRIWFCAFGNYQPFRFDVNDVAERHKDWAVKENEIKPHRPPKVREQVKHIEPDAFHQVSSAAGDMFVIHTNVNDLYERMWCLHEFVCALVARKKITMVCSPDYITMMMNINDKGKMIFNDKIGKLLSSTLDACTAGGMTDEELRTEKAQLKKLWCTMLTNERLDELMNLVPDPVKAKFGEPARGDGDAAKVACIEYLVKAYRYSDLLIIQTLFNSEEIYKNEVVPLMKEYENEVVPQDDKQREILKKEVLPQMKARLNLGFRRILMKNVAAHTYENWPSLPVKASPKSIDISSYLKTNEPTFDSVAKMLSKAQADLSKLEQSQKAVRSAQEATIEETREQVRILEATITKLRGERNRDTKGYGRRGNRDSRGSGVRWV